MFHIKIPYASYNLAGTVLCSRYTKNIFTWYNDEFYEILDYITTAYKYFGTNVQFYMDDDSANELQEWLEGYDSDGIELRLHGRPPSAVLTVRVLPEKDSIEFTVPMDNVNDETLAFWRYIKKYQPFTVVKGNYDLDMDFDSDTLWLIFKRGKLYLVDGDTWYKIGHGRGYNFKLSFDASAFSIFSMIKSYQIEYYGRTNEIYLPVVVRDLEYPTIARMFPYQ